MKRSRAIIATLLFLIVAILAYAEHRSYARNADTHIGMVDPDRVVLRPSPIRQDWILSGNPTASSASIGRTHDGGAELIVWRVEAGRFNWFYDFDETVTILDGEVYLTEGANAAPGNLDEHRLGPGSVVFFRVGSSATWRVPDHVRKVATIKHPLPSVLASALRWFKNVRTMVAPASVAQSAL